MDKIRAFLAIPLSSEARKVVADVGDELASRVPDGAVKWVAPDRIHITMRFLGSTPVDELGRLADHLDRIAGPHPPFTLELDSLGCFPNERRPRVIWVGVAGDTDRLARLQKDIEEMVVKMGWEPERRDFHAHLTLGRIKDRRAHIELPWGQGVAPASIPVREVHLFESQLRPSGAVYTVRHRSYLGSQA